MIDDEKQLILDAMRGGGAEPFGVLYDRHHQRIYRYVYLKVTNREEAEDLTHQVFLSAWQNLKTYRFQGLPFSSWLYRIARNKIIDYYRTRQTHETLEHAETLLVSASKNPADRADDVFAMERVRAAIRRLPADQQDVVIMRFVSDMPYRDVAAAIGKTEGAVKVIQHRALKKLKEILNIK
ncbi:MAG: sigma-70 family RNA polymerase sigma factor [Candidatus Liptonbacteria bacterium]|nr:sigma-70 family RNA polymerase sigma factor [Candidatus Liptonbacteria bacterium]